MSQENKSVDNLVDHIQDRVKGLNCLYKIEDPFDINEIVRQLNLKRLIRATQRKARNWIRFSFRDNTQLMTDLDEEASELRVTTDEWIQEYRISEKASTLLSQHIQKARSLYEKAYK